MDGASQHRARGGLWNCARAAPYSSETQDMLKLMMQELRFNNLQMSKINKCLQKGASLPLPSDPTLSASHPQRRPAKSAQKIVPGRPQKRSAEMCRAGNSYEREKFRPRPMRDLEKEKRRLQNILATGQAEPIEESVDRSLSSEDPEEIDRYQEVLDEINERRQFLEDMAALGQEKKYIHIINTEISQRMRELRLMEKARKAENDAEKNGNTADQELD